MIWVPFGSELRFQPRRSRALGAPPSTFHSTVLPPWLASGAMMWIHECGFTHSNTSTVPSILTALVESNSELNEWWAEAAPAAPRASRAAPAATPRVFIPIIALLLSMLLQ